MFSIIAPMDTNRIEQFALTKLLYDTMSPEHEFVIPTRSKDELESLLGARDLLKGVRLIPYTTEAGFNPSRALNVGVRNAQYDHVIITSPEVRPKTEVLSQLQDLLGKNVVCQVWDEAEDHSIASSLVHHGYRDQTPGFYFLAMYNKADIEAINGWDEEFMKGYAYEDDDFGERWVRAGLPFEIREDIQGVHQYHPRGETIPSGAQINYTHLQENNANGIVKCANGLEKISL